MKTHMAMICAALALTPLVASAAPTVTTYCVGSTEQLEVALGLAAGTAVSQDDVLADIRLQASGTYDVDLPASVIELESLSISGNYSDANCSAVDDAQSTFVTFHDNPYFLHTGSLEIRGIFAVGAFATRQTGSGNATTRIHANRFSGFDLVGVEFGAGSNASGRVDFINNVVSISSSAALQGCAVAISQQSSGSAVPAIQSSITNNTIAGPDGVHDAVPLCVLNLESALVANNIIVDSTKPAVRDMDSNDPTPVGFANNIFETAASVPLVSFDVGTQLMNFVFSPGTHGPFQIANNSPAVNAGWDGAHSYLDPLDIAGNPRRFAGTVVDIGAYEAPVGAAAPLVVSNFNDSGSGSLRAAISSANTQDNTPQTITFDFVTGPNTCGPSTAIQLLTPLPPITDSLTIDGYAGIDLARPNDAAVGFNASLCVVLRDKPGDGVTVSSGFQVPAGASGDGVKLTVKGIDLRGFGDGIQLFGGANHVVQGNAIGIGQGSTVSRGVVVGPNVADVVIGGFNIADRNHLGGASSVAVQLLGNDASLVGNLVGPGRDGKADIFSRNAKGVSIDGNDNQAIANTISGNLSDAVLVQGNNNLVLGNLIGLDDGASCTSQPCTGPQGNLRGVRLLGDDNTVQNNVVANSAQQGIIVSNNASHDALVKNVVSGNGGIGIDLRSDGLPDNPQTSDAFELPSSANGGQNFPVLLQASAAPKAADPGILATGSVSGYLSTREGTYDIEVYGNANCDASGHGEGEELIGAGKVTVVKAQNAIEGTGNFSISVSSPSNLVGRHASVIARASNGDTSEFSSCLQFIAENTAPFFTNLRLSMPRSTGANQVVALLIAYDDGLPQPANLSYSLLTAMVPFTVDPDGTLRVTQANIFDASSIYNLDIRISDGEKTTTGIVTILPTELFRDGFEDELP